MNAGWLIIQLVNCRAWGWEDFHVTMTGVFVAPFRGVQLQIKGSPFTVGAFAVSFYGVLSKGPPDSKLPSKCMERRRSKSIRLGVLQEKLGGGVQPASQNPYPIMTKICDIPYPIYDLTKNPKHYL